jgi:hypothetical protein
MADAHEHSLLIASIVSLCARATIDICGGLDQAIRSIIVISLKYLDRRLLLESVVPGGYVDWNYVDSAHSILGNKQNLLGDSDMWLHLLPYLDFGKLQLEPLQLQASFPPIWTLYRTLEESVGHDKDWKFNDTCRLFLLSNLIGIPFKFITERYTTKSLKQHSSEVICCRIMENMAEERHEAGVYLESMRYLLSICVVDVAKLELHVQHYRSTVAEQKASWTMKHLRVQTRPSMRDILEAKRRTGGYKDSMVAEDTGCGAVTFDAFCNSVRFPNCMSHLLRSRCYLLASQCHFDFRPYTQELLVSAEVAAAINDNAIMHPDEASLGKAINTLTLSIHPFDELKLFRKNCFLSHASVNSNRFTMTDVLRMYVSAYQHASMWKQLWKTIDPVMSTQISKDVEYFVKQHAFAKASFIEILKTSTPFVI